MPHVGQAHRVVSLCGGVSLFFRGVARVTLASLCFQSSICSSAAAINAQSHMFCWFCLSHAFLRSLGKSKFSAAALAAMSWVGDFGLHLLDHFASSASQNNTLHNQDLIWT